MLISRRVQVNSYSITTKPETPATTKPTTIIRRGKIINSVPAVGTDAGCGDTSSFGFAAKERATATTPINTLKTAVERSVISKPKIRMRKNPARAVPRTAPKLLMK